MKRTTVVFGDTHYGYPYEEYGHPERRRAVAMTASDILAEELNRSRKDIDRIVHMGDVTEKLYPTPQHDPELARAQATALGNALRDLAVPFIQLAGNCDPYYDREEVAKTGETGDCAAEWAIHDLWGDFRQQIELHLPGLIFEDPGLNRNYSVFTHGHWLDGLPEDEELISAAKRGDADAALIDHLRSGEEAHLRKGKLYEMGTKILARAPDVCGRMLDAILQRLMARDQRYALERAYEDSYANLFVAGHTHAPAIAKMPMGLYLNPGSLTSACRIDTSRPMCTYATIAENGDRKTITLHRIDIRTGDIAEISQKDCPRH